MRRITRSNVTTDHSRGELLVSAEECRDLVADCLRWAEMAGHPAARQGFLEMAKTWTQAALELERPDRFENGKPAQPPTISHPADEVSGSMVRNRLELAIPHWPILKL